MADTNAIRMTANTWDSGKRRLFAGRVYLVPDEVSAADAEVLLSRGKAEKAEAGEKPVPDMTKAEIMAELDRRQVEYRKRARRGELAAMLEQARAAA